MQGRSRIRCERVSLFILGLTYGHEFLHLASLHARGELTLLRGVEAGTGQYTSGEFLMKGMKRGTTYDSIVM